MSKLTRGQKGERKVIDVLNKVKEYHHLLNDITFKNDVSEMSHQMDHILIHPHGVFLIETKNYYGEIIYENSRWFKIVNNQKIKISDPLLQNRSHQALLYRKLNRKYKVIPVVVFVKNNAPYTPDDNAIDLNDLLLFIDSFPYDEKYSNETIDKIKSIIESHQVDISNKEHVENIKYLKIVKKEAEQEKAYAIEKGICPRCLNKMIIKGNSFRCPKCGFKFSI